MLLKNQWVNEEIKEEIRKYPETNEIGNTTFQNPWDAAKAFWREVYSNTGLPKKTRKKSNKQPYLPSKGMRKRRTKQLNVHRQMSG